MTSCPSYLRSPECHLGPRVPRRASRWTVGARDQLTEGLDAAKRIVHLKGQDVETYKRFRYACRTEAGCTEAADPAALLRSGLGGMPA
mmetsp:Transcript_31941/g.101647  ORF Transcript_31941/g.101647 Transcript_31941/m.101647 type:complete len:88 (+) Transcript_31941:837-1100(+)